MAEGVPPADDKNSSEMLGPTATPMTYNQSLTSTASLKEIRANQELLNGEDSDCEDSSMDSIDANEVRNDDDEEEEDDDDSEEDETDSNMTGDGNQVSQNSAVHNGDDVIRNNDFNDDKKPLALHQHYKMRNLEQSVQHPYSNGFHNNNGSSSSINNNVGRWPQHQFPTNITDSSHYHNHLSGMDIQQCHPVPQNFQKPTVPVQTSISSSANAQTMSGTIVQQRLLNGSSGNDHHHALPSPAGHDEEVATQQTNMYSHNNIHNGPLNLTVGNSSGAISPSRSQSNGLDGLGITPGTVSQTTTATTTSCSSTASTTPNSLLGIQQQTKQQTTASTATANANAAAAAAVAAAASIPQFILASGQLVPGIQGAQLLIPTSQGLTTQTILTIPISHVSSTDQMVNLALKNGQIMSTTLANLEAMAQSNMLANNTINGLQQQANAIAATYNGLLQPVASTLNTTTPPPPPPPPKHIANGLIPKVTTIQHKTVLPPPTQTSHLPSAPVAPIAVPQPTNAMIGETATSRICHTSTTTIAAHNGGTRTPPMGCNRESPPMSLSASRPSRNMAVTPPDAEHHRHSPLTPPPATTSTVSAMSIPTNLSTSTTNVTALPPPLLPPSTTCSTNGTHSNSMSSQKRPPSALSNPENSTADLLVDSPNQPTINQTTCNMVDGINLDEIKDFAKAFKLRRLSLGLTQTQVGQALSVTEGPAYSQSAICSALASHMFAAAQLSTQQQAMFEKLDITPKSAQKIKPVLERWMKEAEESFYNNCRYKSGQNHLTDFIGMEPSKKRKRRTSFTPQALELLNAHFERNTHPSGTEITGLAHQLGYEREVIRIWFCNKRQALKNTVRMMSKGMV